MILIKVNTSDIYCTIGDAAYQGLRNALREQLTGGRLHFAERKVTVNTLQWEQDGDDWMPLSEADAEEHQAVGDLLAAARPEVVALLEKSKANPAMADALLSTPNDSYVFFRPTAAGGYEVALAGWGYKRSERRVKNPGWEQKHKQKAMVNVGFRRDGQPVPGCSFGVVVATGVKTFTTNDAGVYAFSLSGHVESYTLQCEDKEFLLELQPGRTDYWFDLPELHDDVHHDVPEPPAPPAPPTPPTPPEPPTPPTPELYSLRITAMLPDGTPCSAYNLVVNCAGEALMLTTDGGGDVFLDNVPDGTAFSVSAADNSALSADYQFSAPEDAFIFTVPFAPLRFTVVEADAATPLAGAQVLLTLADGRQVNVTTATDGTFLLDADAFTPDAPVQLTLTAGSRRFEPVTVNIDPHEPEYLVQVEPLQSNSGGGSPVPAILLSCVLAAAGFYGLALLCAIH